MMRRDTPAFFVLGQGPSVLAWACLRSAATWGAYLKEDKVEYPSFYDEAPCIIMYDPLADFLGAIPGGRVEYRYIDVVKLAGHSCPTTAGAFLMVAKGLTALYQDQVPERGAISAALRADRTDGATGVAAKIVCLITGAAQDDGFKGLGGRFDRRNLLSFGAAIPGDLRLTRLDTKREVDLRFVSSVVPAPRDFGNQIQRALSNDATDQERKMFVASWQERVRRILVDQHANPDLVVIS